MAWKRGIVCQLVSWWLLAAAACVVGCVDGEREPRFHDEEPALPSAALPVGDGPESPLDLERELDPPTPVSTREPAPIAPDGPPPLPDTDSIVLPSCRFGPGYWLDEETPMRSTPLSAAPELIAEGTFWSPVLAPDRLIVIRSVRNGSVVPEQVEILAYDLETLEAEVLFDQADAIEDPAALLFHDGLLYIEDWGTRSIFQVRLDGPDPPELTELAVGFGGGFSLARSPDSLFLSDYRGSGVFQIGPADGAALPQDGSIDPASALVTELSSPPYPDGIAVFGEHVAWSTNAHNSHLENELVIRDLDSGEEQRIAAPGMINSIATSGDELVWGAYALGGSELARMPLDEEGRPDPERIERLHFCGQPAGNGIDGTLAVFGGAGHVLWEREASTVQTIAGFLRYVALNETHIYYATWDGIYRVPRP